MRVFVATMLGGETGEWCDRHVSLLVAQCPAALRGVPLGTAHLTHFFCANLDEISLDLFIEAVRATATVQPAFVIRLDGLRLIPPGPRPRLISLEVPHGAADLARLSTALVAGVRPACPGLVLDAGKSAHVTLARFRKHASAKDVRAVTRALDGPGRVMGAREYLVDRVEVVRSTLTESGPVYDAVLIAPLATRKTTA